MYEDAASDDASFPAPANDGNSSSAAGDSVVEFRDPFSTPAPTSGGTSDGASGAPDFPNEADIAFAPAAGSAYVVATPGGDSGSVFTVSSAQEDNKVVLRC